MTDHRFPIVVGVGSSEYAEEILEHAFDQALRHERPMLHVVSVVPVADEAARARLTELVRRVLDDAVPADRTGDWRIIAHVRSGRPEEEIVDLAAESFAELIVIGRFEGHKIADKVVDRADCPVLVVTPPRALDASQQQCADCVAVRHASDGEQWFCARHHADRVGRASLISPALMNPTRGGTMW